MAVTVRAPGATPADRPEDAFELRRLDWDTAHFGRSMGVIATSAAARERDDASLEADLTHCLQRASFQGYEHVILRVGVEELRLARVAESCGLRLVDVAVDLSMTLRGPRPASAFGPQVRVAGPDDATAIRVIAQESFRFSRFAEDPFFTAEQTAEFHRTWVTNLCNGLADVVIVATASDEIAGFTSCVKQKDGSGRIPLIATGEEHRRQGVGRALVEASLRWFAAAGITHAYVKTQVANYAALALYHRAGFAPCKGELTYSAQPRREKAV